MAPTNSAPQTKKTRILIISDTHSTPLFPASDPTHAFKAPLPTADILLHTGDMTNTGRPAALRDAIAQLARIPAELKLVIPGNHDATLDPAFWDAHTGGDFDARDSRFARRDHAEAVEAAAIWRDAAAAQGVQLLAEGVHSFTLRSGVRFSVYASAFQPAFRDWAFAYERWEDRYNAPGLPGEPVACEDGEPYANIAANPVPLGVDIMMTHGPPRRRLDYCPGGFAGCEHLLRAVRRVRPRLHCFGHIHEAWGGEVVSWLQDGEREHESDSSVLNGEGPGDISKQGEGQNWAKDGIANVQKVRTDKKAMIEMRAAHIDVSQESSMPLEYGKQTVMVNAAIMNTMFRPMNAGWLIDLELPVVEV